MKKTPGHPARHQEVAVIGGGLGGLATAIRLAHAGFSVSLYEKNQRIGGKMNEHRQAGFRFDTGPSLLTMPFVIDNLFEDLGLDRRQYLDIQPIDPLCRYVWPDGQQLDASANLEKMQEAIAAISPDDARRYPDFLDYSRRIYEVTGRIFLETAIHEPAKLFSGENISRFLKFYQIDPLRTVDQGIRRFFKDPKIIQLFNRYATYNGSNPFRAPATLNIISWVEYGLGGYYIRGGMYRLVEVLGELAQQLGVRIHTGTAVEKILHHRGRVTGVHIAGEKVTADVVVCNADVVEAHRTLMDGVDGRRKRLEKLEPSISGMVFLWGVEGNFPELAHHNIFFSGDYHREFDRIFEDREIPHDPTIYLAVTSKTDRDHAPGKAENWFVLLNMPYLNEGQNWDLATRRMREVVLRRFREMGIDLAPRLVTESVFTPETFQETYASNRGSIYGISSNNRSTAFKRPANRSRDVEGLYFTGGSSHPGGGIPLVLLSGKITAGLILEKAGKRVQVAPGQIERPAAAAML
ncbi:MAG TPA: phytoene desaturase family protein [Calditrichia bacterium]|nr:phytoene desaturase [Calditrichota bacterium]HQV30283.1 phytoene desaturase family protein [Calditrichia bacterium]